MKYYLILLIVTSGLISGYAQTADCLPAYVWSFKSENGLPKGLSEKLTEQFETALRNTISCEILQRRLYSHIESHRQNERNIRSINDLDPQTVNGFKTIQANEVLFGTIRIDLHKLDTILTISVSRDNLITASILAKAEIYMDMKEISSPLYRMEKLKTLAAKLYNIDTEDSSPKKSYSKSDVIAMKLVVSTTRSTAERYLYKDLKTSWKIAEDLWYESDHLLSLGKLADAMSALLQAHDIYLTIYMDGQEKGTYQEATIFRQVAKSTFLVIQDKCEGNEELCMPGLMIFAQGDSCLQLSDYKNAVNYYNEAERYFQMLEISGSLKSNSQIIQVGEKTKLTLQAEKNQVVKLIPSGRMFLGANIKHSGPEGITDFRSYFLTEYNIIKKYPHGALLVKLPWDDNWRYLADPIDVTIPETGKIEILFDINDIQKSDNTGQYQVEVVYK